MTVLYGGVSQMAGGAGADSGLGSALGLGSGASTKGNQETILEKRAKFLNKTFQNAAENAAANSLAASNFSPNFHPVQGQFIAPQNIQTQQNTGMANLYNYLVR
jgi:hypothetical protein